MREKNISRSMKISILILCQLIISSLAPIASYYLDSYAKIIAVKLIYALSFTIPYYLWVRAFRPIGSSRKKRSVCAYKLPAFFVAFAAIVASLQVNIVLIELIGVSGGSSESSMPEGFFGFLFSFFMYAVIPSASEELFARATVMRAAGTGIKAALFSGVIFGLCHFNPYQLFYSVSCGIILSLLYLYTADIKPAIYLHFTVNTVVLILSYISKISSMGVYMAIESFTWLAILAVGVYFCYILLRDHQTALNEKTKEILNYKHDIKVREIFSVPLTVVYVIIILATVLRYI